MWALCEGARRRTANDTRHNTRTEDSKSAEIVRLFRPHDCAVSNDTGRRRPRARTHTHTRKCILKRERTALTWLTVVRSMFLSRLMDCAEVTAPGFTICLVPAAAVAACSDHRSTTKQDNAGNGNEAHPKVRDCAPFTTRNAVERIWRSKCARVLSCTASSPQLPPIYGVVMSSAPALVHKTPVNSIEMPQNAPVSCQSKRL